MSINYTSRGLKHCYTKHGIDRERIEKGLSKGIWDIVTENSTGNDIIFTRDFLAIVIDDEGNLKTAFVYNRRWYKSKCKQGKSCIA